MTASTGLPFLNIMKVGMDWTSYLVAMLGCSSTLSFAKFTDPPNLAARRSTTGSIVLHGPHHTAQKSTKVGFGPLTSLSKLVAVSSTTWPCAELSETNRLALSARILSSSESDKSSALNRKAYFNIPGRLC